MSETTRDLLVLAKTVGANDFPVERPSVVGADRGPGELLRLTPFPWKGADSDPPLRPWSWVQVEARPAPRDPRRDSREVSGEVVANAYIAATALNLVRKGQRLGDIAALHSMEDIVAAVHDAKTAQRHRAGPLGRARDIPSEGQRDYLRRRRDEADDPDWRKRG